MKDENMAGSFGCSDGIGAEGLQQQCLEMQKGLITTIKHCIIQFWISQGNRATGKKQYLKFGGFRHFHSHIKTQMHFLSATTYDASTELRTIQSSIGFFQRCYPSRGYSKLMEDKKKKRKKKEIHECCSLVSWSQTKAKPRIKIPLVPWHRDILVANNCWASYSLVSWALHLIPGPALLCKHPFGYATLLSSSRSTCA